MEWRDASGVEEGRREGGRENMEEEVDEGRKRERTEGKKER